MALSGRRTRTVRTAEKLTFCRSREYSSILRKTQNHRGVSWIQWRNVRLSNIIKQTLNAKHSQRNLLLHLSHQQSLPEELIKACLCVRIKPMRGECDTPAHRSLSSALVSGFAQGQAEASESPCALQRGNFHQYNRYCNESEFVVLCTTTVLKGRISPGAPSVGHRR